MSVPATLERADAIQGWMAHDELRWLAAQAAEAQKIVEVGCWCGRSTRALADHTTGTVWCVDPWTGTQPSSVARTEGGGLLALQKLMKKRVFAAFVENLSDHLATGRVQAIPMRSTFAVQILRCLAPFDFVFLDGDHAYTSVAPEIEQFRPLVRPGGILAGHDYDSDRWPQVTQAVDDLVPERQVLNSIWWTRV